MVINVGSEPSVWVWLGPVLLFAAAMLSLIFTNLSANKREWNKWRRDTLIKLCSEAVELAQSVEAFCESALDQNSDAFAKGKLKNAPKPAARMSNIVEQLHLMSAHNLAKACKELKEAAEELISPTSHLRQARSTAKTRGDAKVAEMRKESPTAWTSNHQMMMRDAEIQTAKQGIRDQLLNNPERFYAEARQRLDEKRAAFVRRGQLELKSSR